MSQLSCDISDEIISKVKKFRFARDIECGYLSFKINRKQHSVELDEEDLAADFETISEDLPEDAPRYLIISYKQTLKDGRVKFPLVFIHYAPPGVAAELNMLFTTTRSSFVKLTQLTTVLELSDKEEFSQDWLDQQLTRF